MDALSQASGLFLGLIGWAATARLLCDLPNTSEFQRRALIVFAWMLWMIPAFDGMVYRGVLSADTAVTYCAVLTGAVAFVVSLSAFTRRSKQ